MYVLNATLGLDDESYLVSALYKACVFVVPDYFCENFESSIYILDLWCSMSCSPRRFCYVQNGSRVRCFILKRDFNDRCDI